MQRVLDPHAELTWLADRPDEESVTGYDVQGSESSTWILHAMYENRGLRHLGTHDEVHRALLERGLIQPTIMDEVNLDALTKDSGVPLGFVIDPGEGEITRISKPSRGRASASSSHEGIDIWVAGAAQMSIRSSGRP